jgi:transcriptional regulator with XRE-family HTH domain
MPKKESFGKMLKDARKKGGYTLRQVASKTDSNYAYLSQLEADIARPSEDLARKLARFFKEDEETWVFIAREVPEQIEDIKKKFPKVAPEYFRKIFKEGGSE